jgi:hypothetical protein
MRQSLTSLALWSHKTNLDRIYSPVFVRFCHCKLFFYVSQKRARTYTTKFLCKIFSPDRVEGWGRIPHFCHHQIRPLVLILKEPTWRRPKYCPATSFLAPRAMSTFSKATKAKMVLLAADRFTDTSTIVPNLQKIFLE